MCDAIQIACLFLIIQRVSSVVLSRRFDFYWRYDFWCRAEETTRWRKLTRPSPGISNPISVNFLHDTTRRENFLANPRVKSSGHHPTLRSRVRVSWHFDTKYKTEVSSCNAHSNEYGILHAPAFSHTQLYQWDFIAARNIAKFRINSDPLFNVCNTRQKGNRRLKFYFRSTLNEAVRRNIYIYIFL